MIEVVCETIDDALKAEISGANRIELCSALALGGLTPDNLLLSRLKAKINIPIMAMIRPRTGNFHYDQAEKELLMDQARKAFNSGADGLVFGALSIDNEVDALFVHTMRKEFCVPITFHRAFDFVSNPMEAIDKLIELGIERILTSGLKPTAIEGKDLIKHLIQKAQNKIIVMPGCGVNSKNVRELINSTGCSEIHCSAKRLIDSHITKPFDLSQIRLDTAELQKIIEQSKRSS